MKTAHLKMEAQPRETRTPSATLLLPLLQLIRGPVFIAIIFVSSIGLYADAFLLTGNFTSNLVYEDTEGFRFTVLDRPLEVTALGVYDQDSNGLRADNIVGLWTPDGGLLAQVTLLQGTSGTLEGGFRWVRLDSPIMLDAGSQYFLAALSVSNDGHTVDSKTNQPVPLWQVGSGIHIDGGVRSNLWPTSHESLAFPSIIQSDQEIHVGPNIQFVTVPDTSSTLALLSFAFLSLATIGRRPRIEKYGSISS